MGGLPPAQTAPFIADASRTPLHYILRQSTPLAKNDEMVALFDLHVNNGSDPTILSRDGISAFTYRFVENLDSLEVDVFGEKSAEVPESFERLLKFVGDFEEIDEFDPVPLTMSLCAVHSGEKEAAAKVEPAVKKWLGKHYGQGFMSLGDPDALRILAFQALQHRAPKLTTNQAGLVLQYAFSARCSVDVIRALVRPGTVNGDGKWDDCFGDSVLACAAERGDLEVVDILLDAGANDQTDHLTAFSRACGNRNHDIVERLAGRLLSRREIPIVALRIAIENGMLHLVKCFIDRIPDLNAPVYPKGNFTALFIAVRRGKMEEAKLLIANGIDVLARDSRGRTASTWAANEDFREYLEQEEDKARQKNKLNGIYSQALPLTSRRCERAKPHFPGTPNDAKSGPPAVLAMEVPKRDSRQERSPPGSEIDPDFRIREEVDESEPVYQVLGSWGSLNVLTTEDVVLIIGGLCVALAGASYVFLAEATRFTWRNRKYATVRNAKWVGWLIGLVLSLVCCIGYTAGGKR